MGNWNATCGITQLPIRHGERVALIPVLVKQHDFLARDTVLGSGAVENNLFAHSASFPVFGTYDGGGGISIDGQDVGRKHFLSLLHTLVSEKRLMDSGDDARPKEVTRFDEAEVFGTLSRGRLLVKMPNQRKAWLVEMRTLYEGLPEEQKGSMSHYLPQMEADTSVMPDFLLFGLGTMMVPAQLYAALVDVEGQRTVERVWDADLRDYREASLPASEALKAACTLSGEMLATYTRHRELVEANFEGEEMQTLLQYTRSIFVRPALAASEGCLLFPHPAYGAVVAAAFEQDEAARQLFVDFILFCRAMTSMRKQWVTQTGGGNSAGFEESRDLYRVVAGHMQAITG